MFCCIFDLLICTYHTYFVHLGGSFASFCFSNSNSFFVLEKICILYPLWAVQCEIFFRTSTFVSVLLIGLFCLRSFISLPKLPTACPVVATGFTDLYRFVPKRGIQRRPDWCRGNAATSRRVAGSIPDGVIQIFYWHNHSCRTMALGSTQSLIYIGTRNISWVGKGDRWVGLTNISTSCADCLEIWEPQPPGTLRNCPGLYSDIFTSTLNRHTIIKMKRQKQQKPIRNTKPESTAQEDTFKNGRCLSHSFIGAANTFYVHPLPFDFTFWAQFVIASWSRNSADSLCV